MPVHIHVSFRRLRLSCFCPDEQSASGSHPLIEHPAMPAVTCLDDTPSPVCLAPAAPAHEPWQDTSTTRPLVEIACWLSGIGYALAPATDAVRRGQASARWMVWATDAPYPGAGRAGLLVFPSLEMLDAWLATEMAGPLLLVEDLREAMQTWAYGATADDIAQIKECLGHAAAIFCLPSNIFSFEALKRRPLWPIGAPDSLVREIDETLASPWRRPGASYPRLSRRQWARGGELFRQDIALLSCSVSRFRTALVDFVVRIIDGEERRRLTLLPEGVGTRSCRRL